MSLLVRRIIVIAIALVLGVIITELALIAMNTTRVEYGMYFGTDGDGLAYYPLTVISFSLFFALILDKFVGSEMLPK